MRNILNGQILMMASNPFGSDGGGLTAQPEAKPEDASNSTSDATNQQDVSQAGPNPNGESQQEPAPDLTQSKIDTEVNRRVQAIIEAQQKKAQESAQPIAFDAGKKYYLTSLPIQRYHLDRFKFVDGYLTLNESDFKEFCGIMEQQPVSEQNIVKQMPAPADYQPLTRLISGIDTTANSVSPGSTE